MEKVGVSVNSITSGKYKDIGSYARLMRDDEKKLLQDIVDSTYDQFLSAVADGRNLDKEMVRTWADGRIFNGEQALKYKLVDEIGALQDALKSAQKLAGLEELHIIKETSHPLDQINSMFGTAIRNVLPFRASILDTQAPLLYFYQPGN
jgi:protease-4